MLTWYDSYEIAKALREQHPEADFDNISLGMIYQWTLDLVDFQDNPDAANDALLMSIFQEWFEEVNQL